MPRKKKEDTVSKTADVEVEMVTENSRKEYLLDLYETMKKEGIKSIGDLENKIANLR